ncbi:hypothetical protein [Burkholderia pyrrocinia]|uniref:hypothetical protein n=1 Tax=Burkholderia pyrrocinia TaxID=60550 RepID=UPI00126039B3|nr:hypothetical protein [Burkholderia pyrrocinia]
MEQKNKGLKGSGMFTRLWKDTIILALRDLQRHKVVQLSQSIDCGQQTPLLSGTSRGYTSVEQQLDCSDMQIFLKNGRIYKWPETIRH